MTTGDRRRVTRGRPNLGRRLDRATSESGLTLLGLILLVALVVVLVIVIARGL
ncbi:MAG: hypothetical protein M3133_10015 [Actinomycetota bacterium]|nr:hypothetical protein [Actinomycetota bacterium]